MNWGERPLYERATAIHEASHGVLSEMIGRNVLSVELLSGGHEGVCRLTGAPVAPWVDAVVSAAGHAAERHFLGKVIDFASAPDRNETKALLEDAGLPDWSSTWAVREIESNLWPLLDHPDVQRAIENVAEALAEHRSLTRTEFLEEARPALRSAALRRSARRFCRRLFDETVNALQEQ